MLIQRNLQIWKFVSPYSSIQNLSIVVYTAAKSPSQTQPNLFFLIFNTFFSLSMAHRDIISTLPNDLLIKIISALSFKESVKTSVLKKRWRNLCHETTNISFKEAEYVDRSVSNENSKRRSFVRYMRTWVSRFSSNTIESFEICLSNPVSFLEDLQPLMEFAVSKQVKKLVIDFSDPTVGDASRFGVVVVQLPDCVYNLTTLDSLKIYACVFDPSRFTSLGKVRSLSVGWVDLVNADSLLSKSPLLETLSISHCWGLDITRLTGEMRECVLENCDFPYMSCSFNLPKVDVFKYSGKVFPFHFERMNMIMKGVCLEFGLESEYDLPTDSNQVDGEVLCGYLNGLRSARTLTVCSYLLQAIQESEYPVHMLRPVETQHLVLKTKLQPKEFKGIRMLLNNCPDLETLTFDILPSTPSSTCSKYRGIDPQTYWLENITYMCLRNTLKVVVVKNFGGGSNELNVLNYLIGSGSVLERVELYVPKVMEEGQMTLARAGLQITSNRVQVLVHTA